VLPLSTLSRPSAARLGAIDAVREAPWDGDIMRLSRRTLLGAASTAALTSCASQRVGAAPSADLSTLVREIERRHTESIQRLQEWLKVPCIAAENTGYDTGVPFFERLLRDAGFQRVERVPTSGKPGVFATLDAGASKWLAVYFMYDVKQVDPREWSSPPFEARLIDKPGLGKVVMARGAVNQKGPEAAFLAALHAFRGAGKRLPVNVVLVAEGEEEIGSPHFGEVVRRPHITAALGKAVGMFMPSAAQEVDGQVTINLGAKGIVELELVASGERWGRGPTHDIHSSLRACVDSPAFHLVQALATLVTPDGTEPAIDGFADRARPLSEADKKLIEIGAAKLDEALVKKELGVTKWLHDEPFLEALTRRASRPTINIEGLVGGYTGEGGKTVLPHRAVAKIDMRLVPDMTAESALAALKAHLAKRGFGDIEVNMTGGYDPTSTPRDSAFVRAEVAAYRRQGVEPLLWPRLGGSWPGYLFTAAPLKLPAAHFGLGHGTGAHAPDEYYLVESQNPKLAGIDGATRSFVQLFYELAS
jgi:acetylornithine deacetylase/succinyl-diaminopimelate desuccinylase-like protein